MEGEIVGKHKMILWSRPKDVDLDNMTNIAYDMLTLLRNYGDEISPKYLTSRKKSLTKEFVMDRNSTRSLLEKSIDKTSLELFNRLTSRISFFSSMDDEKSSGISIDVGNCDPMFNNTFVVHLPESFSGFSEKRNDFVSLFKDLIEIFEPYYGFVSIDNKNQPGKEFWLNNKPTCVHWMNYYDAKTASTIGIELVLSIAEIEKLRDGYFFMLNDDPLDNNSIVQMQREVKELLGL